MLQFTRIVDLSENRCSSSLHKLSQSSGTLTFLKHDLTRLLMLKVINEMDLLSAGFSDSYLELHLDLHNSHRIIGGIILVT